jgi:hypothetical protein
MFGHETSGSSAPEGTLARDPRPPRIFRRRRTDLLEGVQVPRPRARERVDRSDRGGTQPECLRGGRGRRLLDDVAPAFPCDQETTLPKQRRNRISTSVGSGATARTSAASVAISAPPRHPIPRRRAQHHAGVLEDRSPRSHGRGRRTCAPSPPGGRLRRAGPIAIGRPGKPGPPLPTSTTVSSCRPPAAAFRPERLSARSRVDGACGFRHRRGGRLVASARNRSNTARRSCARGGRPTRRTQERASVSRETLCGSAGPDRADHDPAERLVALAVRPPPQAGPADRDGRSFRSAAAIESSLGRAHGVAQPHPTPPRSRLAAAALPRARSRYHRASMRDRVLRGLVPAECGLAADCNCSESMVSDPCLPIRRPEVGPADSCRGSSSSVLLRRRRSPATPQVGDHALGDLPQPLGRLSRGHVKSSLRRSLTARGPRSRSLVRSLARPHRRRSSSTSNST